MRRRKQSVNAMVADAIACDLPDGAYWSMMEELTGLEPIEAAMEVDPDLRASMGGSKKRRASND